MFNKEKYLEFLSSKIKIADKNGFSINPNELHPTGGMYLKEAEMEVNQPTLFDLLTA